MTKPFELQQEPTLADLLTAMSRAIKLSIRTHVPATVVVYDAARQKATVLVQALQVVRLADPKNPPKTATIVDPTAGTATLAPITLVDIPVAWPRTLAGYVTFPLVAGDSGELHVHDRSLEAWLLAGAPTDPQLAFTHALKDAVFHPGLHADTSPITPATDLTATVVEGAQIKLGRTAVNAICMADVLIAVIDAAWAAATPMANDGGANLKTTFLAYWNANKNTIKALKGKVE